MKMALKMARKRRKIKKKAQRHLKPTRKGWRVTS